MDSSTESQPPALESDNAASGAALAKKQKKGTKKTVKIAGATNKTGKRGAKKTVVKAPKKAREPADEHKILKGISKPAARRLFKQIYNHEKLRLAAGTADAIRAAIGVHTKRIVQDMVNSVILAKRQTSYLLDAKTAVEKQLPRSTVFRVAVPPAVAAAAAPAV